MRYSYILLFSILFFLQGTLHAQKKVIEKANAHYKEGEYAEAIPLYETALAQKENYSASVKLAQCYKILNKSDKAEPLYAAITGQEKAKAIDFFNYGEVLMSNGKYDEAANIFKQFLALEPDDARGKLMAEACQKVKLIQPYFQAVEITAFPFNSAADENAATLWRGGVVFASDRDPGIKFLKKKSGTTGRDYLNIYYSKLNPDNSLAIPTALSNKINKTNINTGNASFTESGEELFFTQNSNVLSKNNVYNLQLFSAKANGDSWKDVEALPFSTSEQNCMHPAVSPNGKQVYFISDRSGGEGGTDIYMSERTKTGWSKAYNLGPNVNTAANEGFPFMAKDGKLYFCSKGHPGFGGFDIFFSEINQNGEWTKPVNVGLPINSTYDDISICLNPESSYGLFTSSRNGNGDDLFFFNINNTALPFVLQAPQPTIDSSVTPPIADETNEATTIEQNSNPSANDSNIIAPVVDEIKEPSTIEQNNNPSNNGSNINTPIVNETKEPTTIEQRNSPSNNDDTLTSSLEPMLDNTVAPSNNTNNEETPVGPSKFAELEAALASKQAVLGRSYMMDNIYYQTGQYAVTPKIAVELDKLFNLLQKYPALTLDISAHTECVGDNAANLEISQRRAEIVVEYLVLKSIDPKRLNFIGYGEMQPINHCIDGVTCNPVEQLMNQRIELRILTQ